MSSKTPFAVAAILAVMFAAASPAGAQSQTQTFMLVNGIAGDSIVEGYKNWIDVYSVTHSVTPAGRTVNACTIDIGKGIDSAGPKLWAAAVAGQNLGPVQIDIQKAGEPAFKYYEILLNNARVTSLVSTPDQLLEKLTLTGDSVTVKFIAQSATGQSLPPVSTTVPCK